MKISNDIIREVLLEIEKMQSDAHTPLEDLAHPKLSADELSHYVWLLNDGGLIVATDDAVFDDEKFYYTAVCLTYKGHGFVENIRDNLIWREARNAGYASIDFLVQLASKLIKKKLEQHAGVVLD